LVYLTPIQTQIQLIRKISVNFFAKVLNNKFDSVCSRLLAPNQTAFVKGRYILESVVSAHEIIYEAAKTHQKGLILKLDYEKAYNRVNWHFLEEMLSSRGFDPR
jgi:SAM-dependent MidA family methyltransferase